MTGSAREGDRTTRGGRLAVAVALALAGCSTGGGSDWCEQASALTELVADYRNLVELPDGAELEARIEAAIDGSDAVIDGADGVDAEAFEALRVGLVDLDRVLGSYGYDLLRAQSESDTVEQADLYVLDGVPIADALTTARAAVARRCPSS